jgi:protease secretion system membrane fusion protein
MNYSTTSRATGANVEDAQQAVSKADLADVADTRKPMRLGLWALAIGLGGFMAWATFAPLNNGVPTQGTVILASKRKPVQHLTGGLVSEFLVHEGEVVKADQVLARLNPAVSRASFTAVRQNYLTLSATQSRLLAELAGAKSITFSEEILKSDDAVVRAQVQIQRQVFDSRRESLESALRELEASREGQANALKGLEAQLEGRRRQVAVLQEQVRALTPLTAEGYSPRMRLMDLERDLAGQQASITDLMENINRLRSTLVELRSRAETRVQEYRKESSTLLAQVHRELQGEREKFNAVTEDLERTEIRAPVDGQVVGLMLQSAGAVLPPGQKLMDIVPQNEPLILEAKIPPLQVDRVRVGQHTDVRFSGFVRTPTLVVDGRVLSISHDVLTEPYPAPGGSPTYYLARLEITPEGMEKLGGRQMQAGMQAEVLIKTGETTMLRYLMAPLTKRVAASLKED